VTLHDRQELDNNLGGGTDHNLTFSTAFSIQHGVQAIVQYTNTDHFRCSTIAGMRTVHVRYSGFTVQRSMVESKLIERLPLTPG
jgi:hypothetical protein